MPSKISTDLVRAYKKMHVPTLKQMDKDKEPKSTKRNFVVPRKTKKSKRK